MPPETVVHLAWPDVSGTASIVALALAAAIFVFGAFSGTRGNKVRIIFSVCLATAIGWFTMPLAVKAATTLHLQDSETGEVILVTAMMLFVTAVATSLYEVITVTLPDVGLATKK